MIIGIGTDIIDNRRIKKTLSIFGEKFTKRCFSKAEIEKSENMYHSVNSFAKKYAAKEACAKALGTGLAKGVYWKDIEILNNIYGKPFIRLHNKALNRLNKITKSKFKIEVALSDEKNYSIANVIIFQDAK